MPFSVADLKERATKAKDASVNKYHSTKDRYQSQPTSKTSFDPNYKNPPPPPPSRSVSNVSKTSPSTSTSSSLSTRLPPPPSRPGPGSAPPPVTRYNRPQLAAVPTPSISPSPSPPLGPPPSIPIRPSAYRKSSAISGSGRQTIDKIDWANLSQDDKQAFFSWLDEFFARYLNIAIPPKSTGVTNTSRQQSVAEPTPRVARPSPAPEQRFLSPQTHATGPPPIRHWSKPASPSPSPSSPSPINDGNDFVLSFPPPTTHGSAALDLAWFFNPSTHWDSAWYVSENMPPPLLGNTHIQTMSGYRTMATQKTLFGGTLFSDLSVCWWKVEFYTTERADPNNTKAVKRGAQYLSRPAALGKEQLLEAHEMYGETIAAFAESFEGTGQFCARGECWDLANEALGYFKQYDYVPKPVPSISRTHGHLIFEGKAFGPGNMVGRWRGGDTCVRRGDIVEWREVKINVVGGPRYGYAMLGDPEHTAVVVRDSQPSREPQDGEFLSPAELLSLEVVEQSVGTPPARNAYDMSAFEQGEMWIYRPIGMEAYLGTLLEPQCPPGVQALSL